MKLKQLVRYKIDFSHKCAVISGGLMGISVFLQVLYFTLVKPMPDCGSAELTLFFWFPLVLEAAWIVLLRGVKFNAPGVLGIVGVIVSLLLITQSFFGGGALLTILSIALYVLAGAALLTVCGGFLPYRSLAALTMVLPGLVALLGFIGDLSADNLLRLATACTTFALACFPGALQKGK